MKKRVLSLTLAAATVLSGTVFAAEEQSTTDGSLAYEPYEEELVIKLGRESSQHTASTMYEGDTFENNPYTRYVKEKLNISFEDVLEADGDDYKKQLALATAAGDLPDVFTVTDYNLLVDLVDNGLICDMTEAYETYASDYIKDIYATYDGRCLDTVTFDGKVMAIPHANPDNNAPNLCWMRKDWLDQLGLNPDEDGDLCITADDIEEIAKAFIEADISGKGTVGIAVADTLDEGEALFEAMGAFGNKWIQNEDGTVENTTFVDDNIRNAWVRMNEWYQEGILDPQFGTRTLDDVEALLINNQLGITFGPWHLPDWRLTHTKDANPEAEYIAYTVADANGKVNVAHENPAPRYVVVREGFEHPEAAMKIVNVLFDDLANATEESAPEVMQFIKDGGDNFCRPFQIEILPYNNPEKYWEDHSAVLNGELDPEDAQTAENKNTCAAMQKYLENPDEVTSETSAGWKAYNSRIIGCGASINAFRQNDNANWITPLYPPTLSVMEQKQETLNTMMLQAYIKIVTGEEPIEYFDEFKEEWYKNGGEEIIAELEEFYSNN